MPLAKYIGCGTVICETAAKAYLAWERTTGESDEITSVVNTILSTTSETVEELLPPPMKPFALEYPPLVKFTPAKAYLPELKIFAIEDVMSLAKSIVSTESYASPIPPMK